MQDTVWRKILRSVNGSLVAIRDTLHVRSIAMILCVNTDFNLKYPGGGTECWRKRWASVSLAAFFEIIEEKTIALEFITGVHIPCYYWVSGRACSLIFSSSLWRTNSIPYSQFLRLRPLCCEDFFDKGGFSGLCCSSGPSSRSTNWSAISTTNVSKGE